MTTPSNRTLAEEAVRKAIKNFNADISKRMIEAVKRGQTVEVDLDPYVIAAIVALLDQKDTEAQARVRGYDCRPACTASKEMLLAAERKGVEKAVFEIQKRWTSDEQIKICEIIAAARSAAEQKGGGE